jgi:hypothetical protein
MVMVLVLVVMVVLVVGKAVVVCVRGGLCGRLGW